MTAPSSLELAHASPQRVAIVVAAWFSPESGSSGDANPRDRKPSVLIVEDDALVAEMYRLALTRGGYDVQVAGDGLAGLETATANTPDFVFLDIRMPRMDGLELLKRLRSLAGTRETPVVMLTNFDDGANVRTSMQLGAKEYIVKTTILPGDLPGIVSRWLPRRMDGEA